VSEGEKDREREREIKIERERERCRKREREREKERETKRDSIFGFAQAHSGHKRLVHMSKKSLRNKERPICMAYCMGTYVWGWGDICIFDSQGQFMCMGFMTWRVYGIYEMACAKIISYVFHTYEILTQSIYVSHFNTYM